MPQPLEKAVDTTPVETVPAQGAEVLEKVGTTKVETEPKVEMVPKSELEALAKEKEKVEMRKNQLENELEKASQAGDTSEYERIIEELKAEKEALAAQKQKEEQEKTVNEYRTQVTEIFEKVLENYPKEVQEAAKFSQERFGIDSIVGNATYTFEAEKNIRDFVDGLNGRVVTPNIVVTATNPGITPPIGEKELIAQELEKPVSQRDFSKIIGMRLKKN